MCIIIIIAIFSSVSTIITFTDAVLEKSNERFLLKEEAIIQ